jgi:hypothetical protein
MCKGTTWLERTKSNAILLSEAYRLRIVGRLWWANMTFVVLPAVLSTIAAILAASSKGVIHGYEFHTLAAFCAGAAAVLIAVHKALKYDEYQAECLRLSQAYKSIAISADSALSNNPASLQALKDKIELLTESAKAPLPTEYIQKAENLTGLKLYYQPPADLQLETLPTTV